MSQDDLTRITRVDLSNSKGVQHGSNNSQTNIFYGDDPDEEKLNKNLNENSPYQGLARFTASDSGRFYGRNALTAKLIEDLNSNHVIFLLGSSGSGKSSLVQSGLIPQISRQGSNWINLCFVPNESPFDTFYNSVFGFVSSDSKKYRQVDAEVAHSVGVDTLSETVKMLCKEENDVCLLFIDQFEEIFTLSRENEKPAFIHSLVNLIAQIKNQESKAKIIFAMRTDFMDRLEFFPEFLYAIQSHIRFMTEMTDRELKLVIKNPAAQHGVIVEENLIEEIINDFRGTHRSLPLLQYTLDQLWREDDLSDLKLDYRTYEDIGKVGGALRQRAEAVYQMFEAEGKGEVVEKIFVGLITITADGKTVSRRGSRAKFSGGVANEVVEKLISERLIVSGRSEQSGSDQHRDVQGITHGALTIEVAHEALIDSWPRLQDWAREHEEIIILERQLVEAAHIWNKVKEDESKSNSELWQGFKLERVLELKEDGSIEISDPQVKLIVEAFITKSLHWRALQLAQDTERSEKLQLVQAELTSLQRSLDLRADELGSERFGANYYANLRDLLAAKDWQAADKETALRICQVAAVLDFRPEYIQTFPCLDLRNINDLWLNYSQGKFGFSVQKEIWQTCGAPTEYNKDWEKFGDTVGWKDPKGWIGWNSWLLYRNYTFNDNAPKGHLPSPIQYLLWSAKRYGENSTLHSSVAFLFSRIETCQL